MLLAGSKEAAWLCAPWLPLGAKAGRRGPPTWLGPWGAWEGCEAWPFVARPCCESDLVVVRVGLGLGGGSEPWAVSSQGPLGAPGGSYTRTRCSDPCGLGRGPGVAWVHAVEACRALCRWPCIYLGSPCGPHYVPPCPCGLSVWVMVVGQGGDLCRAGVARCLRSKHRAGVYDPGGSIPELTNDGGQGPWCQSPGVSEARKPIRLNSRAGGHGAARPRVATCCFLGSCWVHCNGWGSQGWGQSRGGPEPWGAPSHLRPSSCVQ